MPVSEAVHFDANSFSSDSQTVTVNVAANCLSMDWTGVTNTPTLAFGINKVSVTGDITFIAAMATSGGSSLNAGLQIVGSGAISVTSNGLTLTCRLYTHAGFTGTLTLQDTLNLGTSTILQKKGTMDTNSQTVTCGTFESTGTSVRTLTLGASTINCTAWIYSGSNLTLTANTATINCSGNFDGGSITTYNNFSPTGATSTIDGSNAFAKFTLPSGTTQTITFTDGTTQTITNPVLSGDSTNQHTLRGTSTGGWALTSDIGSVWVDYCTINYSTVGTESWRAPTGRGNVDSGNNVGWNFLDMLTGGANSIIKYVPPHLKSFFRDKNNRHNGLDPYGWSTEGLVFYLPLWALKNNVAFKSIDAYKHTAAVVGASCLWQPDGRTFDGTDDSVRVPTHAAFNFGTNTDFTLMGWGYATVGNDNMIFKGDAGSGPTFFTLASGSGGQVRGRLWDGTTLIALNGTTDARNAWHLYTATFDRDGNLTVYLDGVSEGTPISIAAVGDLDRVEDLLISGRLSTGVQTSEWLGTIGEVWIYNRLLTVEEILHNYKCTVWRY